MDDEGSKLGGKLEVDGQASLENVLLHLKEELVPTNTTKQIVSKNVEILYLVLHISPSPKRTRFLPIKHIISTIVLLLKWNRFIIQ